MEATDKAEAARSAIKQLFELVGIQKVVCVDDEYADTTEVGEIIGLCSELDAEECMKIPELQEVPFDADEDVQAEVIRSIWEDLGSSARKRVYRDLSAVANVQNDTEDAYTLKGLLSDQDLLELSLEEWMERRMDLIAEASSIGTLFLFDQDFSREGGSQTQGIGLVQDVLESVPAQGVMVGMLSHTFALSEEHDVWKTMADENDIDRDRFVLISKERLREDPVGFARMVKLTALSAKCKILKEKVAEVLGEAHTEARKRVEDINIYDFEHIVFRSSRVEGIWEPETLFRVFGMFHRARARELAMGKEELRRLATTIRSVSDVPTDPDPLPQLSSWKIRRMELYEDGAYINNAHMPLELGDIFRKGPAGKEFILLSQPCDLMVRSDGKRHHAVNEALVAEIVNLTFNENGGSMNLDAYYELPYYDRATGEARYVSFRAVQTVKLWVLDLCVYQDDGASVYKIGDTVPANTVPAWKLHHGRVREIAEKAVSRYQTVLQTLRDKAVDGSTVNLVLKQIIPQSSNDNLFKGKIDLEDKSLDFHFKRIGRLFQPYAAAALTKYANYHSRAAFDHDFGREV